MYVPASTGTRDDMVRFVEDPLELIEYRDWETITLPFGDVQVMLRIGDASNGTGYLPSSI